MASSRGALVTVGQVGSCAERGLRTISLTSVLRHHRPQQWALGTLGRCPLSWGGVGSLHLTLTCVSRCGGIPGDPVFSLTVPAPPCSCPAMTRPSSWSSAPGTCLTTFSPTSSPASLR